MVGALRHLQQMVEKAVFSHFARAEADATFLI